MGRATLKAKALKSKGKGINENSSGASTYVKPKGKKELKRETRKQNLMRKLESIKQSQSKERGKTLRNLDSLKQGLLGDGTEHLSMEEQMALNVKLPDNMLPLRISKNGLTKGTRGQIQKFNIERLQNIMGNQSFQANPFDAMKVHLTNVVAIQNLQSKANEKKNKDHK